MKYLVMDIESGPAPDTFLDTIQPEFDAPANIKDPVKIQAAISEKMREWRERAALDAITGRVLAVGFSMDGKQQLIHGASEYSIVGSAIETMRTAMMQATHVVGYNIKRFDLPFLVKRARALGIKAPEIFFSRYKGRVSFSEFFIDLMEEWTCGTWEFRGQSLDNVCAACGLPRQVGSGKDFAREYAEDREKALDHLRGDLICTAALAERLL
jgi:hypothetical protein